MIDWSVGESSNIRLPAHGIPAPSLEREVDDLRSFLETIYGTVIVTAMEMARLLYGGPYYGSYRYSRESTVNLVRGARWDVLPYAKPQAEPGEARTSQEPVQPEEARMVAICVPPWDLSGLDLQDFAAQRTVSIRRTTRIHPTDHLATVRCWRTGPYSRRNEDLEGPYSVDDREWKSLDADVPC